MHVFEAAYRCDQVEELQQVQPECEIYIAMTKCDLLEDWPPKVEHDVSHTNGSLPGDEEPDERGQADQGAALSAKCKSKLWWMRGSTA